MRGIEPLYKVLQTFALPNMLHTKKSFLIKIKITPSIKTLKIQKNNLNINYIWERWESNSDLQLKRLPLYHWVTFQNLIYKKILIVLYNIKLMRNKKWFKEIIKIYF